jgi:hypothetical protein
MRGLQAKGSRLGGRSAWRNCEADKQRGICLRIRDLEEVQGGG